MTYRSNDNRLGAVMELLDEEISKWNSRPLGEVRYVLIEGSFHIRVIIYRVMLEDAVSSYLQGAGCSGFFG
jgi:hypothetical protein